MKHILTQVEKSSTSQMMIDDPERSIFKVHSDVFTDPKIFEEELDKIFYSSWVYLGHESQIDQPNDYITVDIGEQPLILCKDDAGEVHCFVNRCRHKGTQICRAEMGNSSRFRCFYHGWTYRTDGKLIGVSDKEGFPPSFKTDDLGLTEIPRLGNYKGFIFGSLSADVPTLELYLGNAKRFLELATEKFGNGIEVVKGSQRFGFQGNWKIFLGNTLDFYHTPFVHKSFYDVLGLSKRKSISYVEDNAYQLSLGQGHLASVYFYAQGDPAATTSYYQNAVAKNLASEEELVKKFGETRSKWVRRITGFHLFIFPNLALFDGEPPAPQIRVIRPVSTTQTELLGYAHVPRGCDPELRDNVIKLYGRSSGPGGNVTVDDIEVMNSVAKGIKGKLSPWMDLSKGMHREGRDVEAKEFFDYDTAAGSAMDDLADRYFFRWWGKMMSARRPV